MAYLSMARCLTALGEAERARQLVAQVFAAYEDAPESGVVREALVIATQINDEAWMRKLRGRLALLNAHDTEALGKPREAHDSQYSALSEPVSSEYDARHRTSR